MSIPNIIWKLKRVAYHSFLLDKIYFIALGEQLGVDAFTIHVVSNIE